ncbi:zinc-binding dehydrogenase [Microbacterium sp.]|uniref:zinc-binding dehydrogenase n=1 Tax=Microbacterium sp. TaxID=51671 RepID=UPI003A88BC99
MEDLSPGEPRGREVLVEVKAAGLCHSDMNVATIDRGRTLPLIAGHEMAGVVRAVGAEVRNLRVGDHVVGTEVRLCGECEECVAGAPFRCLAPESLERGADEPPRFTRGGDRVATLGISAFAEVSIAHENQLVRIPREVPFPQASIISCAVSTGVGAVLNAARVRPGETVAVIGLGGVGLNIVQGARLAGAERIIGVDVSADKLDFARRFGATDVVDAQSEDVVERVRELSGRGVHHAFECSGARAPLDQALLLPRKGGTTYLIGIPRDPRPLEIQPLPTLIGAQRSVTGVYMGSTDPRRDIPLLCEFYLQGRLNLDDLVAREIDICQINEAYADQAAGALARTVITSFGSDSL